jgi:hypothetical protein
LSGPIAVVRLASLYATVEPSEKGRLTQVIMGSVVIYAGASLVAAYLAPWSIDRATGLRVTPLELWGLFFLPLNYFQ